MKALNYVFVLFLLISCQSEQPSNTEIIASPNMDTLESIIITTMNNQMPMRPLEELINIDDSGWPFVLQWQEEAKNKVEILPKNGNRADSALFESQVTTRSPMGAIIYESGGILIDNGWIRILGAGHKRLDRELMEWNKGKSFNTIGEQPSFLLVADDAIGGFFALNNGGINEVGIGSVFYLSPDNLEWENLEISYSEFIVFCFSGDLELFYSGLKWNACETDIEKMNGNQGFHFYPYLFTLEGKDIEKVSKKVIPIQEIWEEKMLLIHDL